MIKGVAAFIVILVICFSAAGVGQIPMTGSLGNWYAALKRPPLSPPNWVFGPVWTVLYVMMAWAAWLVWEQRAGFNVRQALFFFAVQLVLNSLWTAIFFGLQRPDIALIEILVLWGTIVVTICSFYPVSHLAAYLLMPYLAWVTFAAYLNHGFWRLN